MFSITLAGGLNEPYKDIKMAEGWVDFTKKPLEILRSCGGFYECPKGQNGERLGPLVGYAGRDDKGRQLVGDIYFNFAKAERRGSVLKHFAKSLMRVHPNGYAPSDVFCGAPEGGKALATVMAHLCGANYIFPEKEVVTMATSRSRETTRLIFARHEPMSKEWAFIVDDVCNNFSTTRELIKLVEDGFGARVKGIICFLNRSTSFEASYPFGLRNIPIISLVRKPFKQYTQDDPFVAEDIASGNVVWKPKNKWDQLEKAMKRAA